MHGLNREWVFPAPKSRAGEFQPEAHRLVVAYASPDLRDRCDGGRCSGGDRRAASQPHTSLDHGPTLCTAVAGCSTPSDADDLRRAGTAHRGSIDADQGCPRWRRWRLHETTAHDERVSRRTRHRRIALTVRSVLGHRVPRRPGRHSSSRPARTSCA